MTNIAEILKDAPKGTKLYSPICGECTLTYVDFDREDPIRVDTEDGVNQLFYANGTSYKKGEILLFPSKENRDWSKFNPFAAVNYPVGTVLRCRTTGQLWIRCKGGDVQNVGVGCVGGSYDEASEKESSDFFKNLSDKGYKWDAKEGKLKKKKEEYTLTTFQKVLGRDCDTCNWTPDFYGFYDKEGFHRCVGTTWRQVIPYEGNEHLMGTTNSPDNQ